MKIRVLAFLCAWMLVCGVSCGRQNSGDAETSSTLKGNRSTEQSVNTTSIIATTVTISETTVTNTITRSSVETTSTTDKRQSTHTTIATTVYEGTSDGTNEKANPLEEGMPVFNTNNIDRITLYAYYGQGTGYDVPSKYMSDITRWLETFSIDRKVAEDVPPGTNTYHVKIEYADGTIVNEGLNVIEIDGVNYYIKSAEMPACFMDIISQTTDV